jgi:hypothetical protein
VSSEIFDIDEKPLAWRNISNVKGNITEEYCGVYLETIIYPALGRRKPIFSHPGQQGVVIWDRIGTHLGSGVVIKTLDLGLETLERAPHLSHILQGEDAVDVKEVKAH